MFSLMLIGSCFEEKFKYALNSRYFDVSILVNKWENIVWNVISLLYYFIDVFLLQELKR